MTRQNEPSPSYAPHVRAQYEDYPFPLRDPEDEAKRLIVTEHDCLAKLNHYCFGGRQRFTDGFRVLVAGGGTGDHAIFLAEQLRDFDASVTYMDISRASMDIAKERARVRQLENIEWHQCSILDIASLGLAPFDLISCTGVLHHLPEPERGLAALRGVLAPEGAMSLMVYGRVGRLGIYAGQELMRLVNEGIEDRKVKTQHATAMVQCLPETNWLLRGGNRERQLKEWLDDESNLYDVLLHEQDRAYSVLELYELLDGAELELIEFTSFFTNPPIRRFMYDPMAWISDPDLAEHIRSMPLRRQQAIAEAVSCVLTCHGFYAAPKAAARVASPANPDMVPFFLYFDAPGLVEHFRDVAGQEIELEYRANTVQIRVGKHSADLLAGIDGSRSIGELFESVRRRCGAAVTDEELRQDFMAFYEPLNILDALLLRHRSVPPFREYRREAES
jgi:2-polyprenyl-3-methyl-5-hydroxy-6-metoxy-1,4-benzoquinol methylase